MEDFTGGLSEVVKLGNEAPADLFDIMMKANQRASLMGCAIEVLFYYLLGSGFRSAFFWTLKYAMISIHFLGSERWKIWRRIAQRIGKFTLLEFLLQFDEDLLSY